MFSEAVRVRRKARRAANGCKPLASGATQSTGADSLARLKDAIVGTPVRSNHGVALPSHKRRYDAVARLVRERTGVLNTANTPRKSTGTLIDTVLGTAVRSAFQYDVGPLTIDLNVSFLRPAGKGRIYAQASIVKKGRQVVVGVADVVDAHRRPLATGRGSFALRDKPQHRDTAPA